MTVNEGEAFVAYGDDQSKTARGLLEAAEKAGLDPSVVRVAPGDGGFVVPESLAPAPEPPPETRAARTTKSTSTTDKK